MKRLLMTLATFALAGSTTSAQTAPATAPSTAPTSAPIVRTLTIHAQAVGERPLDHRLLPGGEEITAGNGATVYLSAMIAIVDRNQEWQDKLERYSDSPFDQLPVSEAKNWLSTATLAQLHIAARRERAVWDLPIREQGYEALLFHFPGVRKAARLLSVEARVAIAEGRFDDAIRSLRTGFALVRDVQYHGVMVSGAMSSVQARMFLEDVEHLISRPGAPNLYWALANLPRPMLDLAGMLREEQIALMATFPFLQENQPPGPADIRGVMKQAAMTDPTYPTDDRVTEAVADFERRAEKLLPVAREHLLKKGLDEAAIALMSPAQIVMLYAFDDLERRRQEIVKWYGLPFWQAYPELMRMEKQIADAQKDAGANPLLPYLANPTKPAWIVVRPDRIAAALQTIEAVRDFAANHDNKPPASLAELSLPTPIDPVTGKPFEYTTEGKQFRITGPAPAENPEELLSYALTLQ